MEACAVISGSLASLTFMLDVDGRFERRAKLPESAHWLPRRPMARLAAGRPFPFGRQNLKKPPIDNTTEMQSTFIVHPAMLTWHSITQTSLNCILNFYRLISITQLQLHSFRELHFNYHQKNLIEKKKNNEIDCFLD